jgi:hypothetical protein
MGGDMEKIKAKMKFCEIGTWSQRLLGIDICRENPFELDPSGSKRLPLTERSKPDPLTDELKPLEPIARPS